MIRDPFKCTVCLKAIGSFRVTFPGGAAYLCEACLRHVETSERPYQWHLWVGLFAFGCFAAVPAAWLLLRNVQRGNHDISLFLGIAILAPVMFAGQMWLQKRIHNDLKAAVGSARGSTEA
jgi:hypothetical protein